MITCPNIATDPYKGGNCAAYLFNSYELWSGVRQKARGILNWLCRLPFALDGNKLNKVMI